MMRKGYRQKIVGMQDVSTEVKGQEEIAQGKNVVE
jgi:hypothetical protein